MEKVAVIPGTFDPVTRGHLDIFFRAGQIFDVVHVLVTHNPNKAPLLSASTRRELIEVSIKEKPECRVAKVDILESGLLVNYCRRVGARIVVRGLRTNTDAAYEFPMAQANRDLAGVETVFLLPDPSLSVVSSTLVRQLILLGGDISPYVSLPVKRFFDQASFSDVAGAETSTGGD